MTQAVALSVAHYPERKGACYAGVCEHHESKMWTNTLQGLLEHMGYRVYRAPVGKLPLKVQSINAQNCDLAIEIHFNACGDCGASGTETLYCPGSTKGKLAAQCIQSSLVKALQRSDRGVKEGWYKMDRPGVIDWYGDEEGDEAPDYFLARTNCPALIIEPEFIEIVGRTFQATYGQMMKDGCGAIAGGVVEFFYK